MNGKSDECITDFAFPCAFGLKAMIGGWDWKKYHTVDLAIPGLGISTGLTAINYTHYG